MIGIENVNEFYTNHYLEAILDSDVRPHLDRWREAAKEGEATLPWRQLAQLQQDFFRYQERLAGLRSAAARVEAVTGMTLRLLAPLGYEVRPLHRDIKAGPLPLLGAYDRSDGEPLLWLLSAPAPPPTAAAEGGVLAQNLLPQQNELVPDLPPTFDPGEVYHRTVEELVTDAFQIQDPPRFVLILGDEEWILADRGKWPEQRLLRFDLEELLGRRERATLEVMTALLHRETLAPEAGTSLVDTLDDSSHKHAYEVSEDLKYALRASIEAIGNEAIRYRREVSKKKVYGEEIDARAAGGRMHPLHVPVALPALHRGPPRARLRPDGLGGVPAGLQPGAPSRPGDAGAGDGGGSAGIHSPPVAVPAVRDGLRGHPAGAAQEALVDTEGRRRRDLDTDVDEDGEGDGRPSTTSSAWSL